MTCRYLAFCGGDGYNLIYFAHMVLFDSKAFLILSARFIYVHIFQGAEFDCVRPLSAYFASFRGQIWSHVNFLARRRGCIDAPVLRFFAELFYYGRVAETPVVVSCTILRGM